MPAAASSRAIRGRSIDLKRCSLFRMSAIFISYTGSDPEGDAWADRLAGSFTERGYGDFRDKATAMGSRPEKSGDQPCIAAWG